MPTPTSTPRLAWRHVILAAAAALTAAYLLVTTAITVRLAALGIRLRGAPDPGAIRAFVDGFTPVAAPAALGLFTLVAASWLARRVEHSPARHARAVGALVAALALALDLLSGTEPLPLLAGAAAALLAGWIGGWMGGRTGGSRVTPAA